MAGEALSHLIQHLRRATAAQAAGGLSDAELLERWATGHDEAAFEVLVWRHGPLILQLLRRLLSRPQDIEDAFQATFLALVRKAGSIRRREAVASWLYKVAYRVAVRAGTCAVKRATRESADADLQAVESRSQPAAEGLGEILSEEVNRLPAKYRATVVLCYLEGRTNAEAAQELGCPIGTIFSRLASARQMLQRRLGRRGVAIGPAALAVTFQEQTTSAAVPGALVDAALRAARWATANHGAAGAVSREVIALSEGALRTMFLGRLRMAAAVVLAVASISGGVSVLASRTGHESSNPEAGSPNSAVSADPAGNRKPTHQRPGQTRCMYSERPGVVLVVGTEIKPGQKAPLGRLLTVQVGGQTRVFQRLQEGDTVEEGQVLVQLDDRIARAARATREARLAAIEAELTAAAKTRDEAKLRYETRLKLRGARIKMSEDDVHGARLTWERHQFEVASKEQVVKVAKLELIQAQVIVDMYQVRSRAAGVVLAIYKKPGEGVDVWDPVLRIAVRPQAAKGAAEGAGNILGGYDAPSQQAGLIDVIGTPVRSGEIVPADRLVTIQIGDRKESYRLLREEDRVEVGQLIARLDDRLARVALAIKKARFTASKAELGVSEKTRDEAERRFDAVQKLHKASPGAATEEDVRGAELTWARYVAEARSKKELVRVAELEWKEAQLLLELYEIRSAVRGVIKAIYKHPGEAVKYLEPVFRIEPSVP
jgi:RNA polymerase sigma factor (sigma-70 family)